MKKLLFIAIILLSSTVIAQDKLYLVFEFMRVDNEQEAAYAETESFWEKIHVQRVKSGDIIGWDLWSLKPGGEDQHFQYLTVNLYNDPVKMFRGGGDLMVAAKKAYPKMSEVELTKKLNNSAKTRDLAVRVYLEEIDLTKGEFSMPLGTLGIINLMKAAAGQSDNYEKAESEIFKPLHQKQVDDGQRGSWGLMRFMSPWGSDTYASHITVDMYKDFEQFFNGNSGNNTEFSEVQQKIMNDGVATRDLKWAYMATLIKKAR